MGIRGWVKNTVGVHPGDAVGGTTISPKQFYLLFSVQNCPEKRGVLLVFSMHSKRAADVIVIQWDVWALVLKNIACAVVSVLAYRAGGCTVILEIAVRC